MKDFMGKAGLTWGDTFSPENQQKLARAILRGQGLGAWEGFKRHPALLEAARRGGTYERSPRMDQAIRSSVGGGAQTIKTDGTIRVDVNGPKGTKVSADFDDTLFKKVYLNRGRSMPLASED